MNKILKYTIFALAALIMAACGKEDPFPPSSETGELSTKKMIVKIENEENVVRSAIDVSTFLVDIYRDGNIVESYVYADMPEVVTLPVGVYTVKVRSGEVQPVAWDAPYFEGEQQFEVKAREITEVSTVVCRLANVRVSIFYDDALREALSDDTKVTVVMGENASIDFAKDETRSAYFAYVPGSNSMVATFSGTVYNGKYEQLKAYTDVAPGNHYKITYTFHGLVVPGDEGGISFTGVSVDCNVVEESLTFNVDVDDPTIEGGDRPSEGGGEVDPPTPPTGDGPKVEIPEGSDIVFDSEMIPTEGKSYKLLITSETGFTDFKVDIVSPYLTEEFLSGVGLTTHLDLVNPGAFAEGLNGLGLPVNVGGSKSEMFDISGLAPLLNLDPDEHVHEFIVTVKDASGTTTRTLKFRNKK